jgi:hypothetical protein
VGRVAVFAVAAVREYGCGPVQPDLRGELFGKFIGVVRWRGNFVIRVDRRVYIIHESHGINPERPGGAAQFLFAHLPQISALCERRIAQFTALATRQAEQPH